MKTNRKLTELNHPFEIRWLCHYDRGHLPITLLKNKIWALIYPASLKESQINIVSLDIDHQGAPVIRGYCKNLSFLDSFFSPFNKMLALWLNDPRPIYRRASIGDHPNSDLGHFNFGEDIFKKTYYVGNHDWIRWQRRQAYLRFLSTKV